MVLDGLVGDCKNGCEKVTRGGEERRVGRSEGERVEAGAVLGILRKDWFAGI